MAFAYSAELQQTIAFNTWGVGNSSLTADQKSALDATWTSGSLTGGAAYYAWTEISQFAQWFEQASSSPDTSLPQPAWSGAFTSLACWKLAVAWRPDRAEYHKAEYERQFDLAIDSFSKTLGSAATITGQTFTPQAILYYVFDHCVRRKESGREQGMRRRILPQPDSVYSHLQWVCNYVWNKASWTFRKRIVTGSISTSSVVTFSSGLNSGETFDLMTTRRLYLTGDYAGSTIDFLNADDFVILSVQNDDETGQPRYFRVQHTDAGASEWKFVPPPDAAYEFKAEICIAWPNNISSTTSATEINRFPPEFRTVLRELTLAKTLIQYGASDGQRMYERAIEQCDSLLATYEERGAPMRQQESRDVYRDPDRQLCSGMWGGAM